MSCSPKKFWVQKMLCQKKSWIKKILCMKKRNFGSKKLWVQKIWVKKLCIKVCLKICNQRKLLGPNKFWERKKVESKKYWVKKLCSKYIGSGKILDPKIFEFRGKNLVQKLGQTRLISIESQPTKIVFVVAVVISVVVVVVVIGVVVVVVYLVVVVIHVVDPRNIPLKFG